VSEYLFNGAVAYGAIGLLIGVVTGAWWVLIPIACAVAYGWWREHRSKVKEHLDGRTWHI
jgi:hypothetical protein